MIAERIQLPPLRLLDADTARACRSQPAYSSGGLSCVKTGIFGSRYEIRTRDRCIATVHLKGLFRPTISAVTADGTWTCELQDRSLIVRSEHPLRDLATVDMSFSDHGGIVRLPDGRAYIFNSDFWRGRAELQTPSGDTILRIRFRGWFRPRAEIEVSEMGKLIPELPWFIVLGWSLIVGYL